MLLNLCLYYVFHRTNQTEEECDGLQQSYGRYAAHKPPSTMAKVSIIMTQ